MRWVEVWRMLLRWLKLQLLLSLADDCRDKARLRIAYWNEGGYAPAETSLMVLASALPSPYSHLLSHEAWCRRWRREGLLDDELWRRARLALADQWMRTYET